MNNASHPVFIHQVGEAKLNICPECGAEAAAGVDCEALFNECLALEYSDTNYWEVQHLTVAAYMLQHSSRLTKEGWLATRQLLREFLVENKSPLEIKKQNKYSVNSGNRKWKITSRDGKAFIARCKWAKTILDVNLNSSTTYRDTIITWARAALEDSESISLAMNINPSAQETGNQHDLS